ncbi:stage II sporulation protein E [Anaerospora sp.]|uniref:stage II sporulation protein E n=1 Tax=Anaerospora sp. TaxID=1960278 RepID=UPI002899C113|nr:stage II sporulation protein E [Anaerospora sp.]
MPKVSVVTLPAEALPISESLQSAQRPAVKRSINIRPLLYLLRDSMIALFGREMLLTNGLAFLLSRVSIMGELSPFGLAFFAAVAQVSGKRAITAAVWAVAGVLSTGRYSEALLYSLAIILYFRYRDRLSRFHNKVMTVPLFLFAVVSLSGMVIALWQQGALYNLLLVLFDSMLCLVLSSLFLYGAPLLANREDRKELPAEAYSCAMVILAIAVAGIGNFTLWDYSVRNIAGSLLIMTLALSGGAGMGASTGVAVGLVIGLSDGNATMAIAVYALAGALAGVFRPIGKYAVAIGFVLGNAIAVMYLGQSLELIRVLAEAALASAAVIFLPASQLALWQVRTAASSAPLVTAEQLMAPALDKLNHLSDMFYDLANAFGEISSGAKEKMKEDQVNHLMAAVGKQVCGECQRRSQCWEKDFYKTYQALLDSFALAEAGSLTVRNLAKVLQDSCLNKEHLVEIMDWMAEKNRNNLYWQKKLTDTRQMVTEQLKATGLILHNLTHQMSKEPRSDTEVAKTVQKRCALVECEVANVKVSGRRGATTIELTKKPCNHARECINTVLPLVTDLIQEKLTLESQCGSIVQNKKCRLSMQAVQCFHIETGIAYASKGQERCGDSCSVAPVNKEKTALMLSDGMGSGEQAAKESAMTIKFLERLLSAGYDVDVAVKTVNSMLMLRTPDETFATVDMAIIDTYSGEAEFLKIGSAPSFIKRVREVTTVQSASLPIGILHQIEIEPVRATLVNGDIIVMVSDGIVDALSRGVEKENWVANFLRRTNSTNPQEIADKLLCQAHELAGTNRRDDMTVLVARLVGKPPLVQYA